MKLFTLYCGRSKKKMEPIMTDSLEKCKRYRDQRLATKGSEASKSFYNISPAATDSKPWKKSSASVGGKEGGWIGKSGYQAHT